VSKRTILLVLGAIAALVVGVGVAFAASLSGSNFEIDTDANLINDANNPLTDDWATVAQDTTPPLSAIGAEVRKADDPSGSADNSFGNGTKEDTAVPSVVDGSIPPNKSDLLNFGVYLETNANGRFLNLFWHRVQEPSGTTNMDFELNKSSTLSANGETPVRSEGDVLIQYDLAQGGTNPQLFVSRWLTDNGTNTAADCEASNRLPCWGARVNLSAAGDATGSINTSAIPAAQADGLGNISPRTFGEAQIDFNALSGGANNCESFGSAYLKSRSSDSFTAALKDFIGPANVNLNQCANVIIRKQTDPDGATATFGFTKSFDTQPSQSNTFNLKDGESKNFGGTVLPGTGYTVDETTLPSGWDFVNVDCSASTGVTPTINGSLVTFNIDANTDVLDCTYNNRSRGTIVVEKITDDGTGSFNFTSNSLGGGTVANPHTITLTTTAAGTAGKDSEQFSNLAPGTYDVAETVPSGWNLVSSSCSDGSQPSSIGLSGGETVTCTFHDAREQGAILITKTRKHAASGSGNHPHSGVTFTVTGGNLPQGGTQVTTNAQGQACVPGLLLSSFAGNYTVTETVPSGYSADSPGTSRTVSVTKEANCTTSPDTDKAAANFSNTPLTDITVTVNSQVEGGTASTMECKAPDNTTVASGSTNATTGDGSITASNLLPSEPPAGAKYTCTIVVDP
jgi:hypothetical protein